MNNIKIKICGIRREEDISYINKYMPDYIGFIFYKKSFRYITPNKAAELKKLLNRDIMAVGVFVDETADNILKLCNDDIIDIVQLHGNESADFISYLKEHTDKPVIRAIRVRSTEQLIDAEKLPCDYLLLDTYTKGDTYGGTGKTFDRELIPSDYRPYFLAGGLNADNIKLAISECNPYAVDLSSSVESTHTIDGVSQTFKDENKIKEIINIIRAI